MPTKLLPRFYSTKGLPEKSGLVPISPRMAGLPFEEMSQAGEKIEGLGLHAANVFDQIKEKELKAIRETKAMEYGQQLDQEFTSLKEELSQSDSDFEKWEPVLSEKAKKIKDKYESQLMVNGGVDRELGITGNKLFNHYLSDFNASLRVKRLRIINERGQASFLKEKGKMLDQYTNESDPQKRNVLSKMFEAEVDYLTGTTWTAEQAKALKESFKQGASDLADVKADKAIMANPGQAYTNLQDSKYLPDLLPKQRQDKVEKANAAFKVFGNEQEKKVKEQQKIAHDEDDRQVGDLFMKGEYTQAYSLAQQSKFLTGDEKRTWATSIESASKIKEDEIDPVIEGSNYAFVNELISKEVNPKTIRDYIMSYEFTKGTRQKLLDRLDTETDKSVNKSKSRAYDYMKGQIMPYGGMLAEVPPLQSANYTKAMNALDDWVDKQRKADKPITQKDIQTKSEELALTFQVGIAERQDFTAKENKEYFESLKKKKGEAKPSKENYGLRPDGTQKGPGFLGTLKTPTGEVSTEISIGVEINGKETLIPSLVPTLTKEEINHLLSGKKPMEGIVDKAVAHAKKRIAEGKSPFAQEGEIIKDKYEINKVYLDAQGRKAKYLGGGKWQLVK